MYLGLVFKIDIDTEGNIQLDRTNNQLSGLQPGRISYEDQQQATSSVQDLFASVCTAVNEERQFAEIQTAFDQFSL